MPSCVLLLSHPPSEQNHSRANRRRNDRRQQPAAERKQHSDVIADERASNTHECARDNAAGRSGKLAGEPGRPSQPVEENADSDADDENEKNVTIGSVARMDQALRLAETVIVSYADNLNARLRTSQAPPIAGSTPTGFVGARRPQ